MSWPFWIEMGGVINSHLYLDREKALQAMGKYLKYGKKIVIEEGNIR